MGECSGVEANSNSAVDSKLAIDYVQIASLKLNPNNPRLHSDKQIRQIARSIEVFGFNVPVLVDGQLRVVAGHGRVQAAQLLGMIRVPAISAANMVPMAAAVERSKTEASIARTDVNVKARYAAVRYWIVSGLPMAGGLAGYFKKGTR